MTSPDPRMLVVDLDGTTLNADRRLAEIDIEAAARLQDAGIPVTIATGRLFTGTQWVAHALGVRGSVAVMNGSELVDATSGEASHGRYLDASTRATVRELMTEHPVATFLFESRRIHYGARHAHHADYLSIWTQHLTEHPDIFEAPSWEHANDLLAIGISGQADHVEHARLTLAEALPPELEGIVFSAFDGSAFLKIRHAAEDKGTALRRLAAERGLTAEACVAVGDWYNDLPMLRVAGRSFAMAHAQDEVRAAAGEVLDASREGGAIAELARRVWGL